MQITQIRDMRKVKKLWFGGVLPILYVSVILLSIFFSSAASEAVRNSVSVCLDSVIPSLFPFMLLSSFLTVGNGREHIGRLLRKPLGCVFGITESSACSVALGFLCSFPVGASAASEAYKKGRISSEELTRLLTFINNPGATFVIGAVGRALSSDSAGKAIYLCVILSSVISGIASRLLFKKEPTHIPSSVTNTPVRHSFSHVATTAISSAARNMLSVCACVITFSVISHVLCSIPPLSLCRSSVEAAVNGFFEISGGIRLSVRIDRSIAPYFCAAVCSWSGLSVYMQVRSVCKGCKVSFVPYVISKSAQSLLSPLLLWLYTKLIDPTALIPTASAGKFPQINLPSFFSSLVILMFALSLLVLALKSFTHRLFKTYNDIKGGE